MSGDGRDEPLGGGGADGDTEPGGAARRQVPSQGGPKEVPGPVVPGGRVPRPSTGSRSGAGDAESCVPQQRERLGGVSPSLSPRLPPPPAPASAPSASSAASSSAAASSSPADPADTVELPVAGVAEVADQETAAAPSSDADLIQRMRDGDDSAYEELFRRHAPAVRRYARTCCRDTHTADDLTAEVFARTLQAVRGGAGPEQAVRAYLLTTVRRVAASWTKSAKREQLVEDFAVFAAQAVRSSEVSDADTLDLGADVLAMHEAEQSMAMRAFRSLPERWQAVLWHTTVEEESPSEVAPLFGLSANATAVLASRAREGLKQAYLQAHVNAALTSGGDCARYADRLGAYARGGLRTRAERGLRKHLEECAKCRLAAGELAHVNSAIPALLPVAVIGWFAAGYALKAAGIVAGGAVGAAGAGAAAAATGSGAAAGTGTAAGAAAGAGAASGGAASGAASGGAAVSEGLGAPAKAGIAGLVAVAAAAGLVYALVNDAQPEQPPQARPPVARPAVPPEPVPSPPSPRPPAPKPAPAAQKPKPTAEPKPAPSAKPVRTPRPAPARPAPDKPAPPVPTKAPAPPVPPAPKPTPSPKPPPPPADYQVNQLSYDLFGDKTKPEVRLVGSSWLWQRSDLSIGGTRYAHGVTTHASSSVVIDLNRSCATYAALVGVDDLTRRLGSVRFSLYGDGERLWRSPVLRGGDPAVPVQVGIAGRRTIRLVVEPHRPLGAVALADWAQSRISCL
ncbi:sigma-70 family RNA polymerase sigma factor [Streptomyces lushanensis]|uniref:sigma-70 family RNA polymerase sigma factor n=1 Tax=Streptomyces lushanensis TaxID=1434255 RepID=UPI0008339B60|nr:sigma-70 family RNA polymerase sigma factor [Streptomyces lushanensis]